MNQKIKIGITDCGKFENYRRWMESVEGIEVVRLSSILGNAEDVRHCDGVLFMGEKISIRHCMVNRNLWKNLA